MPEIQKKADLQLIRLVFETDAQQPPRLYDVERVFSSIRSVIFHFAGSYEHPEWHEGGDVRVLELQMGSPLDILLALASLPAGLARGLKKLFLNITFFEQERQRREAEAANAWEDVYRKRLDNIREAVAIAHNLRETDPQVERIMGRLVDEVASFRSQAFRLTHVELPEDAE